MTPPLTAAEAQALLSGATPGAIDVHRYDQGDGSIDYQLQRAAGTGGTVLGYASDQDGNVRAKGDAALWARAGDLARSVVALSAERDALAAAVRTEREAEAAVDAAMNAVASTLNMDLSDDEWDGVRRRATEARAALTTAQATLRARLDALLAGCP